MNKKLLSLNYGVFLMLVVSVLQSLFIVIVKLLHEQVSVAITVLFYYVFPLLYFIPLLFEKRSFLVEKKMLFFYLIRSFFATIAVFCFFYAAQNIHLGSASVLFNTTPIFISILSYVMLGERVSKQVYLGITVSLIGVIVVFHPGFGGLLSMDSIIGLASGVFMAVAQVMLRYLTQRKIEAKEIVFYLYFFSALWALFFVIVNALFSHNLSTLYFDVNAKFLYVLGLLITLGILSLIAQRLLTKAFYFMPAVKLSPLLYFSVPVASFFGWVGWNQSLNVYFYSGAFLILIGIVSISIESGKV